MDKDRRSIGLHGQAAWTSLLVLVTGMLVVVAGGCDDMSSDIDRLPQRQVRSAPVPLATTTQSARHTAAAPSPATRPAARNEPKKATPATRPVPAKTPEADTNFQHVILLSEPLPPEPTPGLRYVSLTRAPAQEVGGVIAWLYPPAGPIGSRDRYDLLYPSAQEAEAAATVAAELDVPPIKDNAADKAGTSGNEVFALGIGLLYRETEEIKLGRPRWLKAEAALEQALADVNLPPARRWVAGMLAGQVAAERLRDMTIAKRHLAAAEAFAPPESLELMAVWLAQAGVAIQDGDRQGGKRLLGRILAGPENLRGTELYDRAERMKADLERSR
jgi:hypothetical protein